MKRMKFWRLPDNLIRLMNYTRSMHGRFGDYIFQNSHGGRQVKLYQPEIYKNHVSTPLRDRAREIMRKAVANPEPDLQTKLKELFYSEPYYLLKEATVNLRLTNFYFRRKIIPHTQLRIFQMSGEEPSPETDELYAEVEYTAKRKIEFHFRVEETERFYASHPDSGQLSNVLLFYWL